MLGPAWIDISAQDWLPLLFVPLAAAIAWWGYRQTTPALEGRQRLWFLVLRTLSFSLLLIILASPILNRVRNEPLKPRIAVLVDRSASMSTPDGSDPQTATTRSQRARSVLEGIHQSLREQDVAVEVIPFSLETEPGQTIPAWLQEDQPAQGAGTDVLRALEETVERYAGENLQSIVLVTDGRTTHGGLDPAELRSVGRPIFTVGLGDTLPPADLAIDRCDYGPVAYVESETSIRVRVENRGFRGQSTRLRLLRGEELLFEQRLQFEQESGRKEIDIPLELKEPGAVRLSLRLDPLEEELTERNNAREIRIQVLKNKIRVLFVDAQPDWDTAYLVRLFRDDPNVDVELVHHNDKKQWVDARGVAYELPTSQMQLQEFDLFVIGSPGVDRVDGFWTAMPGVVEAGRGLLVLPGASSVYTTPGIFATLAPVLPVQSSQLRAPRFRNETVRLTTHGQLHAATSALTLVADPRRVLAALPPVLSVHVGLRSKPGALDLMVLERVPEQPVLAVSRYGNGHTAALCAAPFWRWGFTPVPHQKQANIDFVGHLVRWLVQPRDVKRVQLVTGKPVYEGGQVADLQAQVVDAQLQPMSDAELRVEVRQVAGDGDAKASILLEARSQRPGEYAGSLQGLGPGEYEATVVADRLGTYVGRDTTRFTVETYSIEFANTSQDVAFLRELAQRSGGQVVPASQVDAWAPDLPRAPRPVLLRSEVELWNTRPLFILFVLLLTTEWLLRKRRGLL